MISVPFEWPQEDNNPLDLVEEFAESKNWAFSRHDDATLSIDLPGQKAVFDLHMEWQDEFSALLIACSLPMAISDSRHEMAAQTLEKINKSLWLGHFDLSNQDKYPTFRHTLLLRMIPASVAADAVADVLDIAIGECNRFYSTFVLLQAGDVRLHDDLSAAVFETIGEA